MSRQLILIRHAKAEPDGTTDHDRTLTERGRRQSEVLGEELRGVTLKRAHVIVSSALRARETWDVAAVHLDDHDLASHALEGLYNTDVDGVLDEVRTVPDNIDTVIVVGHNPTVQELAWALSDETPGAPYDALRAQGYSAATATIFDVHGEWAGLQRRDATLIRYIAPGA